MAESGAEAREECGAPSLDETSGSATFGRMASKPTIAILTGGGDVPGLNPAIRAITIRALREGYRVRIYVPYGTEWYPYLMRRLAERPANLLFIVRSLIRERRAA